MHEHYLVNDLTVLFRTHAGRRRNLIWSIADCDFTGDETWGMLVHKNKQQSTITFNHGGHQGRPGSVPEVLTMDITSVFDWFARDSLRKAEETDDPRQREILVKLAALWPAAARQSRDETSTTQAA
jgi:hypothetical protein